LSHFFLHVWLQLLLARCVVVVVLLLERSGDAGTQYFGPVDGMFAVLGTSKLLLQV
jgi:preprotein translocase subunit SecG